MAVDMLLSKCEDAGILCLLQEESYTSQASFALGEEVKVFGHGPLPSASPPPASTPAGLCPFLRNTPPPTALGASRRPKAGRAAPKGAKASSKTRFQLPRAALPILAGRGLGPSWLGLHADANGALNILRKALPAFGAHPGLSPRFALWWLSPRGLRRSAKGKA